MKSIRAMMGMQVVYNDRCIGRVTQLCLADDLKSMEGLWMDTGLKGARFIPAEQIAVLGSTAVLTDEPGKRRRLRPDNLFRRAVSSDGQRLGAIVDAMIDELTFSVDALVLSRGFWDDMLHGRMLVRHFHADAVSGNIILAEAESSVGGEMQCAEE